MVYHKSTISTDNGIISIRHIECIRFPSGEDLTVDTLKDDLNMVVTMVSGTQHVISMSEIKKYDWAFRTVDNEALRDAIFDKWIHFLKQV